MAASNLDDDAKTRRLKLWWAGEGRARWATSPHPWTALNEQLRAHGVPKHMVDGLTTNIFKLAGQPMPATGIRPEHKDALRKVSKRRAS